MGVYRGWLPYTKSQLCSMCWHEILPIKSAPLMPSWLEACLRELTYLKGPGDGESELAVTRGKVSG